MIFQFIDIANYQQMAISGLQTILLIRNTSIELTDISQDFEVTVFKQFIAYYERFFSQMTVQCVYHHGLS